jgi:hypothetical protein
MQIKNPRSDQISDYLRAHEDAILGNKEPFEIDGKRQNLDKIRLPIHLLVYNIRNGRFAAELRELEASEGRRLNPEKEKDAAKIEELLLQDKNKTEWLKRDLQRVGQLHPATITFDGYIINGNRRAAILNQLYKTTGDHRYTFIEAVRLPPNVSASDLWKFEAGFQLSVDLKADYGPVNELLKIKEGHEYGLPYQDIALILGGDNTIETVKKKLRLLFLIEDYLAYFGQDKRYSIVERRVEHFIDIVNFTMRSDWNKLDTIQKDQILHAVYHMIHDADAAHLEVRKVGQFLKNSKVALEWANEVLSIIGTNNIDKVQPVGESRTLEPLDNEIKELEAALITKSPTPPSPTPPAKQQITEKVDYETPPTTPPKSSASSANKEKLKEVFEATVEKVDLVNQKKKPGQIIKRVENNLQALNEIPDEHLKSYAQDFHRVEELFKALTLRFR